QAHLRARVRVETDLVLAREARVAEILRRRPGRLQHAFEGKIAETIGTQVALDLVHPMAGADQLLARRRVDSVVAGPLDGRGGDAHVPLSRARRPHHLHDLPARGAADDGIVDDHDALAIEYFAVWVQFDLDAEVSDALLGLDERPAHVMVPDEA